MRIDLLADARSASGTSDRPRAASRLPAIERCMARGESIPVAGPSYTDCLLDDFGLRADDAPFAAITLAGEGDDPGSSYWLRADPISLRPTMHRLTGGALPEGELDWSEARARAEVLDEHLRSEGCELVVKHPQRWYVRCPSPQRMRTVAPPHDSALLDETMLPAGPDAARWQRLMTEAQMLFHAADVDRDREARGRRPVNGIWIWGGGQTPHIAHAPYTAVYSDDVLALGLGRLSGAVTSPLPHDAGELAVATANDRVLVAIPDAREPQSLESNWVAPMTALVTTMQASELVLRLFRSTEAFGCKVTRALLRRWWRRARPLSAS